MGYLTVCFKLLLGDICFKTLYLTLFDPLGVGCSFFYLQASNKRLPKNNEVKTIKISSFTFSANIFTFFAVDIFCINFI